MSTTQQTASPRAPRTHHPSSKHAGQPSPNNHGGRGPRKPKGTRAYNVNGALRQHGVPTNALHDPAHAESAVLSSEEATLSASQRQPKKHTRSQPSADRVFSPPSAAVTSLTDSEVGAAQSVRTPAKSQGAYAGPTFHASPAPSALPIPKFLSRSVPSKAHSAPPTPPPDEGSDPSSSPSPSPSRGAPIPIPTRHQSSPLDMLFKADRAERAKNVNCSPPSNTFVPPNPPYSEPRPQHIKQDSFNSLNVPFPIELEANGKTAHNFPPVASLGPHASVTASSTAPVLEATAQPKGSDAIQDLMNRLSMSQKKTGASTPSRNVEQASSDAHMQNHSPSPFHDDRPSPFRGASGPITAVPAARAQDGPELFYGNQNLSSKFKAAKTDPTRRNSGLRTEITNTPPVSQGGFQPIPSTHNDMRSMTENALNGPGGPRRGSAPQIAPIPPYRGAPNNQQGWRPARRSYHARPDAVSAAPPATVQKPTTAMAFIPSSVRAKPPSTPPKKAATDNLALEQNLKRMLNLTSGNTNGVS